MRVLLIEDDRDLGADVRDHVQAEGNSPDWVTRLADALQSLDAAPHDFVLLDFMLPDGRGSRLPPRDARTRRCDASHHPYRARSDQRPYRGPRRGADDYSVKPFDLRELSAGLNAVARRYSGNPNPLISQGSLEVDLAARSIFRGGRPVSLTAREWALFEAFVQRPGQLLSKAQLEARRYSFYSTIESSTIEVRVSHIRKKLGATVSETVRGLGYRLGTAPVNWPPSLRGRLSLAVGLGVTLRWIATGALTAEVTSRLMAAVFDSALQEAAQRTLPLAAALARLQRLAAETRDEAASRKAVEVEVILKRLARLSEKLMQLVRAEGGRLRTETPTDVRPILQMVIDDFWRSDGSDRIEAALPDRPVISDVAPDVFAILVRDLIETALRHGLVGSPVQVALMPNGLFRVTNADPAVPAPVLDQLTAPFERGGTVARGSGLGLPIVKAIAEGAGGSLSLSSPSPGRADGFEASFVMPAAPPCPSTGTSSRFIAGSGGSQ